MIRSWFSALAARLRSWFSFRPVPRHETTAVFHLQTAPLEISPELPEPVAALLREQRARLESGELFGELARASAATGAVITAAILQTGAGDGVHRLTVSPRERERRH